RPGAIASAGRAGASSAAGRAARKARVPRGRSARGPGASSRFARGAATLLARTADPAAGRPSTVSATAPRGGTSAGEIVSKASGSRSSHVPFAPVSQAEEEWRGAAPKTTRPSGALFLSPAARKPEPPGSTRRAPVPATDPPDALTHEIE